jgi:hypothetical protein
MSPTELLLSLLIVLPGLFFWANLKAREVAVRAGKQLCANEGFQFLDDSVALRSLRPWRDADGRLTLQRRYAFFYSVSGYDRFEGEVVLHGQRVTMSRVQTMPFAVIEGGRTLH